MTQTHGLCLTMVLMFGCSVAEFVFASPIWLRKCSLPLQIHVVQLQPKH